MPRETASSRTAARSRPLTDPSTQATCTRGRSRNAAPVSPVVQAPVTTIARPVMEQITMVSMKVPSMATLPPWFIASSID